MPRESVTDGLGQLAAALRATVTSPTLLGYKPGPKQVPFHSSHARVRQFLGGNRSGKTTGGVVESLWWATRRHPYRRTPDPPVRGRVVAVDYPNGVEKIILPQLRQWVIPSDLVGGTWSKSYDKQARTLRFANGSFIELMSAEMDLDKFAGTSRHFVWFDEEPPAAVYTENLARTIDVGGSIWLTMTPIEGQNWTYDTIYLPGKGEEVDRDPTIEVIEVDMTDNPHLNTDEIARFVATLSPEEREARVHGRYVALGGLIYRTFNPDVHVVPPQLPPPEWPVYASMDHGLANPTCWLWHAVGPAGQILTFAEHYAEELTIDVHAHVLRLREAEFGRTPEYRIGDPAIGNRGQITDITVQQEYAAHGVLIILGNNDVEAGINRVRRYLMPGGGPNPPRWQVTADCPNLINQMRRYRWRTFISRRMKDRSNLMEEPLKKDDHAVDALRYFLMSRPDLSELGPRPGQPKPEWNPMGAPTQVSRDPEKRIVRLAPTPVGRDNEYAFEVENEHLGGWW